MEFEWDELKAASNAGKHGVLFAEASSVFLDPLAAIFADEWYTAIEERELIVGRSDSDRLLIVSYVEREQTIRIISARTATRRERKDYEKNQTK